MPSLFENTWNQRIETQAARLMGADILLARDERVTETFKARRVREMKTGGAGAMVSMAMYRLPAASLVIDSVAGVLIEPKQGDRLIEGSDIYLIDSPDDSTPAVEREISGLYFNAWTRDIGRTLLGLTEEVNLLQGGDTATRTQYLANVQWLTESPVDKSFGMASEHLATIRLAVTVAVKGNGHDVFELTDPTSRETVSLAAESLLSRSAGIQTWALKNVGMTEPSRQGYRGS